MYMEMHPEHLSPTAAWRLKIEKYENLCESYAQSTLKDENCPRRPRLNASQPQ